jgi:hypothetical protein
MKGTIFEKSTTSLELWFYAIYLLTSTRCGISAKQLERELGVGYKTAHRMLKRLQPKLTGDRDEHRVAGGLEKLESSGSASETDERELDGDPDQGEESSPGGGSGSVTRSSALSQSAPLGTGMSTESCASPT